MRVEVRLFATLASYRPSGSALAGPAFLELPDGSTVRGLIAELGIPDEVSRIVLVNGREATGDRPLAPGDVVDLFPPLVGG